MPKAAPTHTTLLPIPQPHPIPRTYDEAAPFRCRATLAGIVAALAFPAAAGTACAVIPAAHPDAELLRLGVALDGAIAAENVVWAAAETELEDDGPNTVRANALTEATCDIADRIGCAEATTIGGLLVKMRVVAWCRAGEPVTIGDLTGLLQPPPTDMIMVVSILRDLAAVGGQVA